ncbi:hypothetical protein [Oceanimonas doudoroffii]|uniref:Uncharacterized protein n=1 Tax=Oceanimonas doudoroffii TaxID=84158 RepID=A0A233RCM6_9GAMM|nr:hypothetical protein [Oceanimonas doudoroffii]OXY81121.1 hypothetical protein B6S08_13685 [Oceanimonas doudoroffii]
MAVMMGLTPVQSSFAEGVNPGPQGGYKRHLSLDSSPFLSWLFVILITRGAMQLIIMVAALFFECKIRSLTE